MKDQEALELSEKVLAGTATESERGLALRNLQTNLAITLTTGLGRSLALVERLNQSIESVVAKFEEKLRDEINIMPATDLLSIVERIQSKQVAVLDLYRKIVQGKDLFPQETLSEEERKVVKLIKSFKSKEEKDKFFQVCSEMLKPKEPTDFDE